MCDTRILTNLLNAARADDVSIVMDRKNVGAPERDDAVYKHAPAVTEDRRNRQSAVGILSRPYGIVAVLDEQIRSEEHTSELQSLMRISYAVLCFKKKKTHINQHIEPP